MHELQRTNPIHHISYRVHEITKNNNLTNSTRNKYIIWKKQRKNPSKRRAPTHRWKDLNSWPPREMQESQCLNFMFVETLISKLRQLGNVLVCTPRTASQRAWWLLTLSPKSINSIHIYGPPYMVFPLNAPPPTMCCSSDSYFCWFSFSADFAF